MDITTTDIRDLRREAGSAGDIATVNLCERALGGNKTAMDAVKLIIADARAMDDSWVVCPGCNQRIIHGECGGEGDGICMEAAYAFDMAEKGRAVWDSDDTRPPGRVLQREIIAAFAKSAGTRVGPGTRSTRSTLPC